MNLILILLELLALILEPCFPKTIIPILLVAMLLTNAPVVNRNSIGMKHFLLIFTLYSVITLALSFAVPFPAPMAVVFHWKVLSYNSEKRLLLARFLKELQKFVSNIDVAAAVAPFACLSQNITIRIVSCALAAEVKSVLSSVRNSKLSLAYMFVTVHFLPMRVDSVCPCGIPTMVCVSVSTPFVVNNVAVAAIVVAVMSKS